MTIGFVGLAAWAGTRSPPYDVLPASLPSGAVTFFDAPISGSPTGAASGDLALWIGGDALVDREHRALLTRRFLPGQYMPPAFLLELAHKDVTPATQMARDLRVPVRLADQTMAEMIEALGRRLGSQASPPFSRSSWSGRRWRSRSIRTG